MGMYDLPSDDVREDAINNITDWEPGTIELLGILKYTSVAGDQYPDELSRKTAAMSFNRSYATAIEEGLVPEMTKDRTRTRLERLREEGYVTRDTRPGGQTLWYSIDPDKEWQGWLARGVMNAILQHEMPISHQPMLFDTYLLKGYNDAAHTRCERLEDRVAKLEKKVRKLE